MNKVATVKAIWIYPVKSMRGISVESADMYWYGLRGDRRYAFVQDGDHTVFPWLTGREVPKIVQYQPAFSDPTDRSSSPLHVTTPTGENLPVTSAELQQQFATQLKNGVHLMNLNRGTFDAAPMSIVSLSTLKRLSDVHGSALDKRRFRINVIVEAEQKNAYVEDGWIGSPLSFGDQAGATSILPVRPINRCVMINIDPDTAERDANVLKNVNQSRDNCVGVYAFPHQIGQIKVGDVLYHHG